MNVPERAEIAYKTYKALKEKREILWKEYLEYKIEGVAETDELIARIEERERKRKEVEWMEEEIHFCAVLIVGYIFEEEGKEG